MRRIIPFMVIVTILLSMGLSAAATETNEITGEVKAGYVEGTEPEQIISVEIKWSGMNFTYNGADSSVWDPVAHKYNVTPAGWAESDARFSIINHSNVILRAGISYNSDDGFKEMGLEFTDDNPYIGSAETGENAESGNPCEVVILAVPTGSIPENTSRDKKVGEIKVKVTPVDSQMDVINDLETLYDSYYITDEGLTTGEVYYETAADVAELEDLLETAKLTAQNSKIEAQKNAALNAFLTAYYGKLRVIPEAPVTD